MPALPTSIGAARVARLAQAGAAHDDVVLAHLHQRAERAHRLQRGVGVGGVQVVLDAHRLGGHRAEQRGAMGDRLVGRRGQLAVRASPAGSKRMFMRARNPDRGCGARQCARRRVRARHALACPCGAAPCRDVPPLRAGRSRDTRRRARSRTAAQLSWIASVERLVPAGRRLDEVDVRHRSPCCAPAHAGWRRGSSGWRRPRRARGSSARPRRPASASAAPARRARWRARAAGARRTPSGGRGCRRRSRPARAELLEQAVQALIQRPRRLSAAGVRYQVAPSNSSSRACSTPAVSAPGERVTADEALVGRAPRASARLVEPTSLTTQSGACRGERRATVSRERADGRGDEHDVGARARPRRRCSAPARRSRRARARGRSAARRGRSRAPARPRAGARARPIEPPISPTPRTATLKRMRRARAHQTVLSALPASAAACSTAAA